LNRYCCNVKQERVCFLKKHALNLAKTTPLHNQKATISFWFFAWVPTRSLSLSPPIFLSKMKNNCWIKAYRLWIFKKYSVTLALKKNLIFKSITHNIIIKTKNHETFENANVTLCLMQSVENMNCFYHNLITHILFENWYNPTFLYLKKSSTCYILPRFFYLRLFLYY